MIRARTQSPLDLASAWVAGVSGLFLVIGLAGAWTPLSPPLRLAFGQAASSPLVPVEEFVAPADEPAAEPSEPNEPQRPPSAEVVIPALPVLTPPLHPPEMLEVPPLEALSERPPAPPQPASPAKPETAPEPLRKPAPPSSSAPSRTAAAPARKGRSGGAPGGASEPVPFSAAGGGTFPAPAYPSSARSALLEGTVVLLVTVESSGVPTSVDIRTSSGHTILDTAARDHLRRNWRWPSGPARLFLVPIKFVLR
ncbi:MAG: TonB family protein [Verrucomicrobiota bacterium]|jgi:protein TonB